MALSWKELKGLLLKKFPPNQAEDGDNVGVQIAPAGENIERALLCLDPTESVLAEAEKRGAEIVISHHPLIFKPLHKLEQKDLVWNFVRKGIGLFSAHTNFDRMYLAPVWGEKLGLKDVKPFGRVGSEELFKLAVFVPRDYKEQVQRALFEAGAGYIGNYSHCSFSSEGEGTFYPQEGTSPFLGKIGRLERVQEVRLETVVPAAKISQTLKALHQSHPYEEIAYDIYSLANEYGYGLGVIGYFESPFKEKEILKKLSRAGLQGKLRVSHAPSRERRKVAVVPGKGGKFLGEAARLGADIFITGDLDYHQFQEGEKGDMLLVDPGHYSLEIIGKEIMKDLLYGYGFDLILAREEKEPFYFTE